MKVMLTQRNQITIPKNLVTDLGLELGKFYELNICEGKIELDITKSYDEPDVNKVENIESVSIKPIKPTEDKSEKSSLFTMKIVSNLEEGKKFSHQILSDCGLVIRTKRSYMTKFCEACNGKLSKEYGEVKHPCPYLNNEKENPVIEESIDIKPIVMEKHKPIIESKKPETKQIISKIIENTEKLNSQIDNQIENINKQNQQIKTSIDFEKLRQLKKLGNRLIRPVKYPAFKVCIICDELYQTGFLIDEEFYCKECAKADFYNYLDKRKECEK